MICKSNSKHSTRSIFSESLDTNEKTKGNWPDTLKINMQMKCDEDQWSLPSDKGQGRINTFIILYPKRKQRDEVISINNKKGIERSS